MLAGYCWPQSGQAGETISLAISSSAGDCRAVISRVGATETVVAEFEIAATQQPVPDDASVNGCGWDSSAQIQIDPSWQSGFYLIRLSVGDETAEAFFVVRASEPGDTLLVLSTSTWAAYNDWGGPSFYTGGHRSSQLRPLPTGFLDKPDPHINRIVNFASMSLDDRRAYFSQYSPWSGAAGWANWEKLFVTWAEQQGLQLDYATSLDLATHPDLLAPYKLYVSVGHDEYWSAAMRDHVEGWVDDGGAAVFFSGNTSFWQVRFEDDDTQVVGYKLDFELDPVVGTPAEHTVSTMWSDPLTGRPENEMTGVSFTRGGYANCWSSPKGSGGYSIWRPDHWAFAGLDLRAGDVVGAEPVVVGYECDGCEMQLVDGLPVPTGSGGTPADFEILGTAPAHLWATEEGAPGLPNSYVGELNWVAQRLGGEDTAAMRERFAYGAAVMGSFTRGAGTVFTVGCTDWAYGLNDEQVSQITRNVLGRFVDF